jgi:hypothetical protein
MGKYSMFVYFWLNICGYFAIFAIILIIHIQIFKILSSENYF